MAELVFPAEADTLIKQMRANAEPPLIWDVLDNVLATAKWLIEVYRAHPVSHEVSAHMVPAAMAITHGGLANALETLKESIASGNGRVPPYLLCILMQVPQLAMQGAFLTKT